jgi:hypothetical protein
MSSRGRAVLSSLALVVLLALPLLPEILGTRRLVFRDAQITHWPWRRVAMQSLAAGEIPFVNAVASGGEALLANPNAVLLYPTVLFERILPPAPAFNLHYLVHVLWAFFGARLLARRLWQSEGAAFLAGAAFAFSGMMLSYASGFANSSAGAAWLPWCGAAALSLSRAAGGREALARIPALALALGLQLLAGEPALSVLTLLFCGGLGLVTSAARTTGRAAGASRFAAALAAASAAAAAIASSLLLPLLQILPLTYRGQHVYSERAFSASPFALWRAIEWLFPRFSGDPGALGAGGHWQHALHRGDLVYVWCVTFGVIPLLLVLLAALSRAYWRGPVPALAAAAVGTLLFAFGSALPFFRALAAVAVLRRLRYPIKFYLLTTLCVALLAGFAADHLARRRLGRREAILLAAVALAFLAAIFLASDGGLLERRVRPLLEGLAAPADVLLPAISRAFRVDAILGIAAAAVLAAILGSKPREPAAGYLLGFAVFFFALPWGLPLFVSAGEKDLERPPALLSAMKASGRLFVSPRLPEFNVLATGSAHPEMEPRVSKLARVQIEELIPGTGEPFNVRYLFDADPDGSYGYYNRLAGEALAASTPAEKSRLLRTFAARFVLAEEGEAYPGAHPVTGLTVAGRRLTLLELEEPIPELRWASRAFRRRSLSGALALVRSEAFDPSTDVVLPGSSDRDDAAGGSARIEVETIGSAGAAVRVESQAPGHLIFSRTFLPAWRARVEGLDAPVLVANARDLAVAVPAGSHRVEFLWDPTPFVRGIALQAIALVLLGVVGIFFRRSRRSAAPSL